jgi:hypothetical protein
MARRARTRAHYAGMSIAKLRHKAERFAAATEKRAQTIAYEWGDVDNYVVMACDRLVAELEQWRVEMKEALERLAQDPEAEDAE